MTRARARRTAGAVAVVFAGGLVGGCGGSDGERQTGCIGDADGGTVVVQGTSTVIADNVSAGVGSIDVNRDDASAILTVTQGTDPNAVRSVPVTVGTTVPAGAQELSVVQICRGSVTIDTAR